VNIFCLVDKFDGLKLAKIRADLRPDDFFKVYGGAA
jgi:hypothetical protein